MKTLRVSRNILQTSLSRCYARINLQTTVIAFHSLFVLRSVSFLHRKKQMLVILTRRLLILITIHREAFRSVLIGVLNGEEMHV